jgi:hypothetical protein
MARTGPASAFVSWIWRDISGFSFSAVRVVEMAFRTRESFPETTPRLLDEASQVKTSGVMVSS